MNKASIRKLLAFLTALCLLSGMLISGTVTAMEEKEEPPEYTVLLCGRDGDLLASLQVPGGMTLREAGELYPGALTAPKIKGAVFKCWRLGAREFDLDTPVTSSIRLTAFYKEAAKAEKPVKAEVPA
ncbi:MAG: hypothetical protein GXY34_15265, partial [Syntrophomonadaceae bacterium]|nr:hypothetical protein [Syntrophomonadaceae bacterium]